MNTAQLCAPCFLELGCSTPNLPGSPSSFVPNPNQSPSQLAQNGHGFCHSPAQSYCFPGRAIQDNLLLLSDLVEDMELFGLTIDIVSVDQDKAFDWVNHDFLVQTLEAFGCGPIFTLQLLYQDICSS